MQRLPARALRGTVAAMNTDPKIRAVGKSKLANYNSGGDRLFIPHGVYRFKTHEEADAWMVKMLARSKQAGHPEP